MTIEFNKISLSEPSGPGATTGIVLRTNQEYLGRNPAESGQGRGIIQCNGYDGGHWEPLHWWVDRQ